MRRDFLSLASELSMLAPEVAEQLAAETARTGDAPETLITRRGLLSPVQMDIVQTLLRPTETVPGYELQSTLGHGGMGVVYRARQVTLDRVVAIKTILVNQIADRSMASRFEQEARAVARLKHPNIIAAIDFGQHDGRLFFVMELVEGQDLDVLIERQQNSGLRGSCSESLAWGLARQTASGLAHAAEQGVVHRDIKPANLLLVDPPAGFPLPPGLPLVKIADFGLAFLATAEAESHTRLTAANTTVGSPHYIAPEQIAGEPVDARADIYALGATMFHLLSGRPPYSGRPLMQILSQKMSAEAPRLSSVRSDISIASDKLVADMMTRRPEDRVASYAELLRRIDDVLQGLNSATMSEMPSSGLALTADLPRGVSAAPIRDTGIIGPTQAISVARPVTRQTRRGLFALVAVVALSAAVATTVAWLKRDVPIHPQLVASGWSEPLFYGRSLRNWNTRGGLWVPVEDEESARVLAGTNGVIARRLLRSDEQSTRPLMHFELSLAVRMHQASAVELHFGLFDGEGEDPRRLAMRMEGPAAWLAHRNSDRGPSQPATAPVSLPTAVAEQPRIFRLRRDATHWIGSIDGLRVGTFPLGNNAELSEIRLFVEGGPAWFSDIEVEELVAPGIR